jgi:hypothetical protein
MGQILAGPRRAKLAFLEAEEGTGDVRSFSQMLKREGVPDGLPTGGSGPCKGWGRLGVGAYVAYRLAGQGERARELDVGRVLRNVREEQRVVVHL